jgi:hypothetical protein
MPASAEKTFFFVLQKLFVQKYTYTLEDMRKIILMLSTRTVIRSELSSGPVGPQCEASPPSPLPPEHLQVKDLGGN